MGWLWMNVPLMIVFFLCWSAIPLYLVLTSWHARLRRGTQRLRRGMRSSVHVTRRHSPTLCRQRCPRRQAPATAEAGVWVPG